MSNKRRDFAVQNNIIENMEVQKTFTKHTLNDKEALIDDYIMIAGMSPEEAEYAAQNCLREDLN